MSMGSKRRSWRSQRNLYNYLTRDLQNRAVQEKAKNQYEPALRLCLLELWQMHRHYYPACDGHCPADEAMKAARKALGIKQDGDPID